MLDQAVSVKVAFHSQNPKKYSQSIICVKKLICFCFLEWFTEHFEPNIQLTCIEVVYMDVIQAIVHDALRIKNNVYYSPIYFL